LVQATLGLEISYIASGGLFDGEELVSAQASTYKPISDGITNNPTSVRSLIGVVIEVSTLSHGGWDIYVNGSGFTQVTRSKDEGPTGNVRIEEENC
jgi:hypothetical protein